MTSTFTKMRTSLIIVSSLIVYCARIADGLVLQQYGGSCYLEGALIDTSLLSVDKVDHTTAGVTCAKLGSKIIEIETEAEMEFIRTLLHNSGKEVWVGLVEKQTRRGTSFEWETTRKAPHSSLWMDNEPNDQGSCVRLTTASIRSSTFSFSADPSTTDGSDVYYLADTYCTSLYHILCERNVDPTVTRGKLQTVTSSDRLCPMGDPVPKTSRLRCAAGCAKDVYCLGFTFDTSSKACTYFQFQPTTCSTFPGISVQMYVMTRNCSLMISSPLVAK